MPESTSAAFFCHATGYASLQQITPGSGGADLSVVRHLRHRLTHNFITMSRLRLCLKKVEISGLVRHPSLGNPYSLSHNPHPTPHRVTQTSDSCVIFEPS
jgi:hypothetical protein